jgi:nucleotide-binding universal stress UspA family protein
MDLTQFPAAHYHRYRQAAGQIPVWTEILVPTDFSPCADNALQHALGLALASGARIRLLNAVYLPLPVPGVILNPIGDLLTDAENQLKAMAADLQAWLHAAELPQIEIQFEARVGFAPEEIVACCKAHHSALVVMGTQGAGGAKGFFWGSNASAVIRHAECPVYVVPGTASWGGIGSMGYATDLEVIDTEVLQTIAQLASLFQSRIEALHVTPAAKALPPQQAQAFVETVAVHYPGVGLRFSDLAIPGRDIGAALEEIVATHGLDLLVLYKQDHHGLGGLFHRSLTEKMALHAQIPLLVCH